MHSITYYTLYFFMIGGAALLLPGALALLLDGELGIKLATIFFGTGAACLGIGFAARFFLTRPSRLGFDAALSVAALGWLLLATIGALPYALAYDASEGVNPGLAPEDAFFESMSGFTATGLTMYPGVITVSAENITSEMVIINGTGLNMTAENATSGPGQLNATGNATVDAVASLPRSILFWRSFTQWLGGVGVIVIFISLLIRSSGIATKLYKAEGRTDKIAPTIASTARKIWTIYMLYTGLCIAGLIALGVDPFASVNLAMTTLATGGFAVTANGIGGYQWYVAVMIIPFMILGGISFVSHTHLLKGKLKEFFSIEVRAMFLFILLFSILLGLLHGALHSSFQVTSAITGTGFSTTPITAENGWNDFSKFIMSLLMVMGGGYGSTASALKMIRVVIFIYSIGWIVKKSLYSSNAKIPFRVGKKIYPIEDVRNVALYSMLYLVVLMFGALFFMAEGFTAMDSIFEVASAEGNVGLSTGITNAAMKFHLKAVLILEMWVGRLEILPVLTLLAKPFKKFA